MWPAGFEWDPEKERKNIRERSLNFGSASRIWAGAVVERPDQRRNYGEIRIIATGYIDRHTLVVVYTWRGERRRIISARKANAREKSRFEEEIARRKRALSD